MEKKDNSHLVSEALNRMEHKRICPICGNDNLSYQIVKELIPQKLTVFQIIVLLMIPVIGWVLLAANNSRGKIGNATYALCSKCGKSWIVEKDGIKSSAFMRIVFPIILIFIIVFMILILIVVPATVQ